MKNKNRLSCWTAIFGQKKLFSLNAIHENHFNKFLTPKRKPYFPQLIGHLRDKP